MSGEIDQTGSPDTNQKSGGSDDGVTNVEEKIEVDTKITSRPDDEGNDIGVQEETIGDDTVEQTSENYEPEDGGQQGGATPAQQPHFYKRKKFWIGLGIFVVAAGVITVIIYGIKPSLFETDEKEKPKTVTTDETKETIKETTEPKNEEETKANSDETKKDTASPELTKVEIKKTTDTNDKYVPFDKNANSPAGWTNLTGASGTTYDVQMSFSETINHTTVGLVNQGFTVTGSPTADGNMLVYTIQPTSGSDTAGFTDKTYLFFPKEMKDVAGNHTNMWPSPEGAAPTDLTKFIWYQKFGQAEEFVVTHRLVQVGTNWHWRITTPKYNFTTTDLAASSITVEDAKDATKTHTFNLSGWTVAPGYIQSPANLILSKEDANVTLQTITDKVIKVTAAHIKHTLTKNKSKPLQNTMLISSEASLTTPKLSSNTSDSNFIVETSSNWSTEYDAWMIFDTSTASRWWCKPNACNNTDGLPSSTPDSFHPGNNGQKINGSWVKIKLNEAKNVTSYSIDTRSTWNPKIWKLYGSNDGTNYTPIDSRSLDGTSEFGDGPKQFTLTQKATYKFFVLHVTRIKPGTENWGSLIIEELKFNPS